MGYSRKNPKCNSVTHQTLVACWLMCWGSESMWHCFSSKGYPCIIWTHVSLRPLLIQCETHNQHKMIRCSNNRLPHNSWNSHECLIQFQSECPKQLSEQITNQCLAIQYEFELVGSTMLKNPLGVGWGLLHKLRWVGSWLPTYLASFLRQAERKLYSANRIANRSFRNGYLSTITQ